MKPFALATSFGWPFLVTLGVVGPTALLGSCDDVTTCGAKGFVIGPIILIAFPIAGFVAGRVSSSSLIGFVAILAAAALVASLVVITGIWYVPDGQSTATTWLLLTGLTPVLFLPGFLIGHHEYKRAALVNLAAQRDAGTISSDEFRRQVAMGGWKSSEDQAAPGHRCGRCGKPVSPVWHGKCKHCGASYVEYPPVPRTSPPQR